MRIVSNPDYLGSRHMLPETRTREGKKMELGQRYDSFHQKMNHFLSGEQQEELLESQVMDLKKKIREAAWIIKRDIIDREYRNGETFGNMKTVDQEYYALLLERKAQQSGIQIYRCKNMWYARSVLSSVIKAAKYSKKRRSRKNRQEESGTSAPYATQVIS